MEGIVLPDLPGPRVQAQALRPGSARLCSLRHRAAVQRQQVRCLAERAAALPHGLPRLVDQGGAAVAVQAAVIVAHQQGGQVFYDLAEQFAKEGL